MRVRLLALSVLTVVWISSSWMVVAQTAAPPAAGAEKNLAEVKVPAGFGVTMFAGPPNVSYPTCIAATPSGPVFVGVDQNGSLDRKPGRGWVVRCVDADGDGVADQFTVFAKMDSPRGIVFDHNVLYVMHPPVVEAYFDDNGDGVADRSEVLVRGLGHDLNYRGADHTSNGIRMGMDGWLYIAVGDYGAKAVGKDGAEVELHGGGIIRVRPDGSEMELVVRGTRNIYDVAIDPLLNLFTCDNTNDGDDWNVRLSHMIPTANYGYPSLFRHFSDEMIPTMVDYGGGAPTGSLFIDEPGYPGSFGYGLYTCQWGWNTVTRHPLEALGASFKAEKEAFISIPRPTGIDEDGQGHLFVASWKGATFTYAGPSAGYVVRVSPLENHPTPFPDLAKATDADLLTLLESPSAVRRWNAQRELLHRGQRPALGPELEKLALSNAGLAVRVAAICTLKQMFGVDANGALLRIAGDPVAREFALRALADRKSEAKDVSTRVFGDALKAENPRVRLAAVVALDRLGRWDAAEAIVPLSADPDPAMAHVAFRALVELNAVEPCLKAVDQADPMVAAGALRALRNLHDPRVVDGLIERLDRPYPPSTRRLIAQALCRLYYREADWDGMAWWGTRPDTSGPYYKAETWDQSAKIGAVLEKRLAGATATAAGELLADLRLNKVDSPGITTALLKLGTQNGNLRPAVAGYFGALPALPPAGAEFLERIASSADEEIGVRTNAFEGLLRGSDRPEAADAVMRVIVSIGKAEPANPLLGQFRDEFTRDGRRGRMVSYLAKVATETDEARSQLAYAALLQVANNRRTPQAAAAAARQAIDEGWNAASVASLLRAVGDAKLSSYAASVKAKLADSRPAVAAAAIYAQQRVGGSIVSAANAPRENVVGKLPYERVLAEAIKAKGNAQFGAQLFQTQGCVTCHTTLKDEPVKGPFLGDIAARYGRSEIIESILKPNAQIAQGFVTSWFETKDGEQSEGFIVKESGEHIEIRNLAGPILLTKKDIVKRGTRPTSIMPEGLVDSLTVEELASLLAYFESLKAP